MKADVTKLASISNKLVQEKTGLVEIPPPSQ